MDTAHWQAYAAAHVPTLPEKIAHERIAAQYTPVPRAPHPWQAPKQRPKAEKMVAAELERGTLRTLDGEWNLTEGDQGAYDLALALFTNKQRGTRYVFRNGPRHFAWLWKRIGKQLVDHGYTLKPWIEGKRGRILAWQITHTKAKASWYLCDLEAKTGITSERVGDGLEALQTVLDDYQKVTYRHLGEPARLTVGSLTVQAAAKTLPHPVWAPASWVQTLCRQGGGFRGGVIRAYGPYQGPAYSYDVNGAYLAAQSTPLPARRILGPCVDPEGRERPGIYICTVRGPGRFPIYLSTWNGQRYLHGMWNDRETVCVLPESEFAGIRALGYQIIPGRGVIFGDRFTLERYQRKLIHMMQEYPRGSWERDLAKRLAVSLYGKLAQRSDREEYAHSAERPGADWHPFVPDDEGDTAHDIWTRRAECVASYQQIDMAAAITGAARSSL